ncbi:hypothetical protein PoB_003466700 [Plakobranchus ocellatus]|uniref:Uncharacterized protein n=1 Tax=Plakobranchus ocellatus TaxID=259542 RepID=A0AAV4AMF9_9GAST|nr:hypothetical protein PoB_003466700 [Plakobranchus ocellatus]
MWSVNNTRNQKLSVSCVGFKAVAVTECAIDITGPYRQPAVYRTSAHGLIWSLYIASQQQDDLRLSEPSVRLERRWQGFKSETEGSLQISGLALHWATNTPW